MQKPIEGLLYEASEAQALTNKGRGRHTRAIELQINDDADGEVCQSEFVFGKWESGMFECLMFCFAL